MVILFFSNPFLFHPSPLLIAEPLCTLFSPLPPSHNHSLTLTPPTSPPGTNPFSPISSPIQRASNLSSRRNPLNSASARSLFHSHPPSSPAHKLRQNICVTTRLLPQNCPFYLPSSTSKLPAQTAVSCLKSSHTNCHEMRTAIVFAVCSRALGHSVRPCLRRAVKPITTVKLLALNRLNQG